MRSENRVHSLQAADLARFAGDRQDDEGEKSACAAKSAALCYQFVSAAEAVAIEPKMRVMASLRLLAAAKGGRAVVQGEPSQSAKRQQGTHRFRLVTRSPLLTLGLVVVRIWRDAAASFVYDRRTSPQAIFQPPAFFSGRHSWLVLPHHDDIV